jgi:hypothetical protein
LFLKLPWSADWLQLICCQWLETLVHVHPTLVYFCGIATYFINLISHPDSFRGLSVTWVYQQRGQRHDIPIQNYRPSETKWSMIFSSKAQWIINP